MNIGRRRFPRIKNHMNARIGTRVVIVLAVIAAALAGAGTAQARPLAAYTGCANPTDQTQIPEAECLALVALYDSTAGATWTDKTGWKTSNTPCTDWYGVTCLLGNVHQINLNTNNLTGSIPTEIGNLTNLFVLKLNDNSLGGTIPASIGNLSNLASLELISNSLTGSIPVEMGNLTNLGNLRLDNNSLSGSLPVELSSLTNLSLLGLTGNTLSGSVPSWLGDMNSLEGLALDDNLFSGVIPPELGNLTNLTYLYLGNNNVGGSIPVELGNLSNIAWLKLNNTQLFGTIPAALGNLTTLVHLDLSNTNLDGTVPSVFGNLSSLITLYINDTSLSGWLPSSLTNITTMKWLRFNGTSLCERPDTAFQDWLTNIDSTGTLISTGVTCNILLSDDFESGNFSAWDAAKLGGGDLKVCAKAAITGAKGMCVKNLTNNTKFVSDSGLSAAAHSAQFNLDPNGLNLQNLKIVRILLAKDGTKPVYWLQMRKKDGKFQLRVAAKLNGGETVISFWRTISNAPHLIEVEWAAARDSFTDNGFVNLYIDGQLRRTKSALFNDTFVVDQVRLGFTNNPSSFLVSGIFFIDDYLSSDSGYIGE